MPQGVAATMTSATEADRLIAEHMPVWPGETVRLEDAADRILAAPITAERDIPAFDRVTMDGIAIEFAAFAAGLRDFSVAGVQPAGAPAPAGVAARDRTRCGGTHPRAGRAG